jgi:phosphoribosylformylglycinamidine (FGAM) synthase PurS component
MKFGVKVLPRDVILDTQGRAVEQTLGLNKMKAHCRVGRYIELEIDKSDYTTPAQASHRAEEIVKFILYNPLIEKYEIEMIGE